MPGIFITGTDTEIGKTQVACALLKTIGRQNVNAVGMKPVASGAELIDDRLQNEDALQLIGASSVTLPYELVNPYVFKTPASPHISAKIDHQQIELDKIVSNYRELESQSEFMVVEGVGGWLAPLNETQTVADLAVALQLPVVLVVGMRLGCLSHALLTAQHINKSGLKLAGWIANCVDKDFPFLDDNINTLQERIDASFIARLDFNNKFFSSEYEKSISALVNAK